MNRENLIPSVNFHLWEPCNMRCKFCFATFQDVKHSILPKGHLSKKDALAVIRELAKFGFKKISFAGGEPMLCPWLTELIREAKSFGMKTMLITNGAKLSVDFLEKNKNNLDWVALSVDSINAESNLNSGRHLSARKVLSKETYLELGEMIRNEGYKLKINTVVHKFNYNENMYSFIAKLKPERWKVMRVLPIKGQNDKHIKSLEITDEQFSEYTDRHNNFKYLIVETNVDMINSYVMVDPAGRFFNNSDNAHDYSEPILNIGVDQAYNQMNYNYSRFKQRGGEYEF